MEFHYEEEDEKRWKDEVELAVQKIRDKEEKPRPLQPITYYIPKTSLSQNKAHYSMQYIVQARKEARDTTKHVPIKRFETLPMAFMGPGLLGFTYLWQDFMVVRDDLHQRGDHHEVYVHEAIHTEDEYETRQLTAWMMDDSPAEYEEPYREEEYSS